MKIVITTNAMSKGGGIYKYICNLCDVLSTDNNELHIITTHADKPQEELELIDNYPNLHLHQLHRYNKISKYINLTRLIYRLNPDLIICNFNAPTQFVLPFCKRKAKVVHIIHGYVDIFYRIASINAKYVDGWITPTPGVKVNFDKYTQHRYSDRVCSIFHGVESPNKYGIQSHRGGKLSIVFAGVLYEHKGVLLFPEIVKKLHEGHIDFHFTIIGNGIERDRLEKEMHQDIQDGYVELTGFIPPEQVYQKMANAHIFLYPTRIDSFGLVIAEAMMNGAVPVVSRLSGITDAIVDDQVNGCIIDDMKDAEAFAAHIIELNRDRDQLTSFGIRAKLKAETGLSLSRFYENYVSYFKKILSE